MFNYIKTKLKKTPDGFYTLATILAAAQINYAIVHSSFVYIVLLIMLAHELAHYFIGKHYKGKAKLPFFIPLPFFIIGITRISKLSPFAKKNTALAGPIVGLLSAILIILYNYINTFMSFVPLFVLAISEIITNFFGTDGAKYKQAKKEMKACISY